ncbi:hypothetical protein Dimus_021583 [Dionaea muscipula]
MASVLHSLLILFSVLFHVFVVSTSLSSSNNIFNDDITTGFAAVTLRHRDSGKNLTKSELLKRAIERGKHRLQSIKSRASLPFGAFAPVSYGSGEYVMTLAIGTPRETYTAIVDTGSDLIWTQCRPCKQCFSQPAPIFDPRTSRTYKQISCKSQFCGDLPVSLCLSRNYCAYLYEYGDGSYTIGTLSSERFTFGEGKRTVSLLGIIFGCGNYNGGTFSDTSGLVGFGGGNLSLVSQLPEKVFSYCLVTFGSNQNSILYLGSLAADRILPSQKRISLRFVPNDFNPTFYYVPLTGIKVGLTTLPVSSNVFAVQQSNGSGGVIVDSGTTLTYIPTKVASLFYNVLGSQIGLTYFNGSGSVTGLSPCWFKSQRSHSFFSCPKLVFHFKRVHWEIPCENYLIDDVYKNSPLVCSVIQGTSGPPYIIGNIMQQNHLLRYDLKRRTLTLAPTKCAVR